MQFWQVMDHKAHTDSALHCDVWKILNIDGELVTCVLAVLENEFCFGKIFMDCRTVSVTND